MTIHHDIERLKKDPKAAQTLAHALLSQAGAEWSDWELDFLESMAAGDGSRDTVSTRQAEKLLELKEASRRYERIDGFSVKGLIKACSLARVDLADEDEAFIASLAREGVTALKLRPLKRLIHCSRQLGIIEHYVAI